MELSESPLQNDESLILHTLGEGGHLWKESDAPFAQSPFTIVANFGAKCPIVGIEMSAPTTQFFCVKIVFMETT